MTVYAITDTKKGRTGIAPTYLQTTRVGVRFEVRVRVKLVLERHVCISGRKTTFFSVALKLK